jgi:hypothetical protein
MTGRLTITDWLPILLEEVKEKKDLLESDPQAFRAHFDADPRWEPMRQACPRMYFKVMKGDVDMDNPHLKKMFEHIDAVRNGQKTMKQVYREVDTDMVEKFVYTSVGRPDAFGNPMGPEK